MYLLNNHHIEAYMKDVPGAINTIKTWTRNIPKNAAFEIQEPALQREIPLYDLPLSAGNGVRMFDESMPFDIFRTTEKNCDFALRVSGDSMEPDIPNHSIVLIKKSDIVSEGKIGAFFLNGEVYCKRLSRQNKKTLLCSNNSKYPPIDVLENDTLTTYGQVVKTIFPEEQNTPKTK